MFILSKLSDIIHSLFGTYKTALLPVFDKLLPYFQKLLVCKFLLLSFKMQAN